MSVLNFFGKKWGGFFWDTVSCVILSPMFALVRDDPLSSASQVLWLKACAIAAWQEPTSKHCRFLFPEIPKSLWVPTDLVSYDVFRVLFLRFLCQRATSGISTNCTEVLVSPQGQAKFFLQTRYRLGKTGQIYGLIYLVYMHIKQMRQINPGLR